MQDPGWHWAHDTWWAGVARILINKANSRVSLLGSGLQERTTSEGHRGWDPQSLLPLSHLAVKAPSHSTGEEMERLWIALDRGCLGFP